MTEKDITKREYEVLQSMEFNEDILITDPCYVAKEGEWCRRKIYGNDIKKFITSDTLYGDWGCRVWKANDYKECVGKNVIGRFCADAGLVSIMSYDEAKAYNPKLEQWVKEHDWCATVISNFKGTVEIRLVKKYVEEECVDRAIELFGLVNGEVVWIAAQTGF